MTLQGFIRHLSIVPLPFGMRGATGVSITRLLRAAGYIEAEIQSANKSDAEPRAIILKITRKGRALAWKKAPDA